MVIFYRSTLDERLFYLDQQMWNPLYKAIALKTAKWNDVYMRNPNEDGPQEKLITFDKNISYTFIKSISKPTFKDSAITVNTIPKPPVLIQQVLP